MEDKKTSATVGQSAPVEKPVQAEASAPAPVRPLTIERQGGTSEAVTARWPEIRSGICEFCGVIDRNLPSTEQYKLCPHFRNFGQLQCSYCDESKNPDDVIYHSVLHVAGHPTIPDKVIVWCDSRECTDKHNARFKVNK